MGVPAEFSRRGESKNLYTFTQNLLKYLGESQALIIENLTFCRKNNFHNLFFSLY